MGSDRRSSTQRVGKAALPDTKATRGRDEGSEDREGDSEDLFSMFICCSCRDNRNRVLSALGSITGLPRKSTANTLCECCEEGRRGKKGLHKNMPENRIKN